MFGEELSRMVGSVKGRVGYLRVGLCHAWSSVRKK